MENSFTTHKTSIQKLMKDHSDITLREFELGNSGIAAILVFVSGMIDSSVIDQNILKALMSIDTEHSTITKAYIVNQVLTISQLTEVYSVEEVIPKVLLGKTALLIDGFDEMIMIDAVKDKSRNLEEPISESLVRGPRLGFNESIHDNMALLRKHGENDSLSFMSMQVGARVKKELVIAFIKDIADPELIEEVRKRIKTIDIDNVLESGYVEQLIEDNFLSPFPQLQSTERPDRVIAALLEGRVAILLDGTPFTLIAPVTFSMLLQSPEDYYERWIASSLLRILRFFAAVTSLLTPAMYISFISFHQGLIPTKLAISILGARVGVPFSSLVEALIMEVAIEILREAGLRLPKPIGPAMGIVGGLIIGEAAVQAGIVNPILVIVVAFTAISSFSIPQYNAGASLRMLRFVAMFFAAALGLYGVVLFCLLLGAHVAKLKSFGVNYASPSIPYRLSDWKDFIVRMPTFMMKRRPQMLQTKDERRQR